MSFFILFGEVLFFAKLLDVYSYYVFYTPTLFACLLISVDEELRCLFFIFIVVCDDREINGVTLLTQVHIPTQSLKVTSLGGKKA